MRSPVRSKYMENANKCSIKIDIPKNIGIGVSQRMKYFRSEKKHGISLNSGKDLSTIAPILLEPLQPRIPPPAAGYASTATSTARSTPAATLRKQQQQKCALVPLDSGGKHKFLRRDSSSSTVSSSSSPKVQYPALVMRRKELPRIRKTTAMDTQASTAGWTTLHFAAKNGKLEVCEHLLAHGNRSDVRIRDVAGGHTPLHIACSAGHIDVSEYLIRHGADVNALAADGCSPLDRAMQSDRRQLVKVLRAHKARNAKYDPTALKCTGSRTTLPI